MCGDITDLPLEESVDIVLVSAFPGNYSTVRSTLIGALYRKFNLRVGILSRHKDADLRTNFSCWVSKPLPEELPYKRLVCFERTISTDTVYEQIARVYRAFIPIFNGQDTTLISPLLATGNQAVSPEKVLEEMVNGACGWILSGLPLRHMKLVIYSHKPKEVMKKDKETVKLFRNLKKKWENICKQRTNAFMKATYDVYLSYHPNDEKPTNHIISHLKQIDPSVKIFSKKVTFTENEVWQEKIYDEMVKSKRIIAVLTPAYINDGQCLEQFNMAMCCNRLKKRQVLAPFYMETVNVFPSYMLLVQYVECRIRTAEQKLEVVLLTACTKVVNDLKSDKAIEIDTISSRPQYDVFISYAHRSPKMAENFLKVLQSKATSRNVFFDKSELSTGSVWQKTLYEAIDNTKVVVAFLSEAYCQSVVCAEEYNIALARHIYKDNMILIPVCCEEEIESVPTEFNHIPILDGRINTDAFLKMLATKIEHYISSGDKNILYLEPESEINPPEVKKQKRKNLFDKYYSFAKNDVVLKSDLPKSKSTKIAISYAQDSMKYAAAISHLIANENTDITCELVSGNHSDRLSILDSSDKVVILISPQYINNSSLMEEFYVAFCKQRASKDVDNLYLIQTSSLESKPVFMSLVPYDVSFEDTMWIMHYESKVQLGIKRQEMAGTYSFSHPEYLAMKTAALDLSFDRNEDTKGKASKLIVNIMTEDSESKMIPIQKCIRSIDEMYYDNDDNNDDDVDDVDDDESICDSESQKKGHEIVQSVEPVHAPTTSSAPCCIIL